MNYLTKTLTYMVAICLTYEVAEAGGLEVDTDPPNWATFAPSDGYDPTKDKKPHEMRPASELIFVEDYSELRRWAREGYRDSQDKLVQRYVEGVLNLDKEADLAGFWEWEDLEYRILTQPGYLNIIYHYFNGEGEDRLPGLKGRLLALFDSAPTDPLSQYILGYCYYCGLFYTQAAKWFLKAAEQGHALGQYCYGVMCHSGKGVKRSDKEAAKWYLRAAIQELAVAQYYYGLACKKGIGVPRNAKEAKGWFEKAAAQGHEKAKQKLRELT